MDPALVWQGLVGPGFNWEIFARKRTFAERERLHSVSCRLYPNTDPVPSQVASLAVGFRDTAAFFVT